ncbi:TolB, C-terminal domain-containing protein [Parathielavia hyrcaniae]|uniref:TolB, C-terminal domain-containing protein n=1 Tax=Parathielavia hyrcaniae TaxID=113614 RepID=A0AAN6T6N6_9PEZI|nr:TolB, C-terminal domain-containing protein [Parathielavia hyrcaniae]
MQFSRAIKSSTQSLPSPDGRYVATVFGSVVNVRAVSGLEVINVVKLGQDFAGPVLSFQWSPSSRLLLIVDAERVRVASALDGSFSATVRNHVAAGTKPAYVGFGASDAEICVISSFGLKFTVFDLASSKATEIGSPKVFSSSSASRCFSLRPETRHLALLTRASGKDMVSIHGYPSRELQRSWAPDTIDAQALAWSLDGRWLVVWESPAHGHRVLFYTSDGHAFKTWSGPADPFPEDRDYALGGGVKSVEFSADARYLAIGDFSRSVSLLSMSSVTETIRLRHPKTLVPKESLQVWQEQIAVAHAGPIIHTFLRTTQAISPAPALRDNSEPISGCASISFDPSSVLVATRQDDSPGTVWIWDVQAAELRAVLLFHGNVATLLWHPRIPETLLVRCEGDQYNGLIFAWDPLSEGPRSVDFVPHLPGAKAVGRVRSMWLGFDPSSYPSVFFSDAQNYVLACLGDTDHGPTPWGEAESAGTSPSGERHQQREESPLHLVPASGMRSEVPDLEDVDGCSELEDTFVHKR